MSGVRRSVLRVVAGALIDDGRVLIAQRPEGKPLAGQWEFPGGKIHEGEASYDALVRELHEELGVRVERARKLIAYTHAYPGRDVALELWLVTQFNGVPQPLDQQSLRWMDLDVLEPSHLLEADAPMVQALKQLKAGDRPA